MGEIFLQPRLLRFFFSNCFFPHHKKVCRCLRDWVLLWKANFCLSYYWCSTGQRYIYTGSHDCCVYIFDLVFPFLCYIFCSTFHCIILTIFQRKILLRTVVYMMESISPTLYYRKWQLFTALLPQKHSRTGELRILFYSRELFHSLRATSHFP